eukprot:GILK01001246.1.p1 GENE.GILK01001246.1~~GILK01001246.1.p1  ORF type:complete len:544 (-),score=53.31 GILK01001246.1:1104-2597(-)
MEDRSGFDYDLFVIGGGSGGLAASKEAQKLGAKVGLADYVRPSPQGTTWGLGGTCVNVGCIPKKLFHTASLVGEHLHDAGLYGWQGVPDAPAHDWGVLVENVNTYIRSLNWGYKTQLRSQKIDYYNLAASFADRNTILLTNTKNGQTQTKTARYVLIAVGGRPSFADIEGAAECTVSSDDIFTLARPPGKTLVVGGSYVALECGGFLSGLGYDTTVMIRSIPLRGFDQDMAGRIVDYMEQHNTRFIRGCVPLKFEKTAGDRVKVTYQCQNLDTTTAEFDTVLLAVGRKPETSTLALEKAGVYIHPATGKVVGLHNGEATNVDNIFAIGDCLHGKPELTPVAIQAGRVLAQRLFGGSNEAMDYDNVPTTVFTPLEYGCVGLSEEEAVARYGEDRIEVYHSHFKPLEWQLNHDRADNACYTKLICLRATDGASEEKVLGMHVLGPNAGEITQGFGVALKAGATKKHFESTIGIHPTCAEEVTAVHITKRSGLPVTKTGC